LSELARGLGEGFDDARQAFANLLKRLSELAPFIGAALDASVGGFGGSLFATGSQFSARMAAKLVSGPTLDELRSKLRKALLRLCGERMLVIIDDLDRLMPKEALEMVSLVKSVGDLPNVIYLLSYEEGRLNSLIAKAGHPEADQYLEKIVQYPVTLPHVEDSDLTSLLDADLSDLLGELTAEEKHRFGMTWHFVFQHYLKTPRDIRRYINSMAVAIPALRGYVDPVDFALLEILRLYEPEVYGGCDKTWVR
jgi:hypothetical protein